MLTDISVISNIEPTVYACRQFISLESGLSYYTKGVITEIQNADNNDVLKKKTTTDDGLDHS